MCITNIILSILEMLHVSITAFIACFSCIAVFISPGEGSLVMVEGEALKIDLLSHVLGWDSNGRTSL
jgi:hypothetical protein